MNMNDLKKKITSQYFEVTSETKDYVVIRLNDLERFEGNILRFTTPTQTALFWQDVLDTHGIFPVLQGFPDIICKREVMQ